MLIVLSLLACGPGLSADAAKEAVRSAAEAANPPGRTGIELMGKSRWVQAPMFNRECVEQKDLAFADTPADRPAGAGGIQRISPTYFNQRYITAATVDGWCVLIGEDIQVEVGEPAINGESWMVPVNYSMKSASPWFECLEDSWKGRTVQVSANEAGEPTFEAELDLAPGACPLPMPPGEERPKGQRPKSKPKKAPSKKDVLEAAQAFDQALWDHDLLAALEHVSCYNLLEDAKYGSCTSSELIQVGPHPRGEQRMEDGVPWTELVIRDLEDIGRITKDSKIPTMYHVNVQHKRTKRDRSFAVEWVDGEWKVVGVLGRGSEDLASLRFMYDLHRADRRDIFLRRLEGEAIDEKGNPLDPYASEDEEEEE